MAPEEKNSCDPCSNPLEVEVSCPETFTSSAVSWNGYGLDPYGSSGYGASTEILPVVKRGTIGLASGYKILYVRERDNPYENLAQVFVYSSAENKVHNKSDCSVGYYFTTKNISIVDLGATAQLNREVAFLYAEAITLSPAFEYGKTLTLELNAMDYAGNSMDPFIITFTIESN